MRFQYGPEYALTQPQSHTLARKRKPPTNDGSMFVAGLFQLTPAEKKRAKMSKYEIEEVALKIAKRESGNCELPRTRAAAQAQTEEWDVEVVVEPLPAPTPPPLRKKRVAPAALTPAQRAARKKLRKRLATHTFECENGCGFDATTEIKVIMHERSCNFAAANPDQPPPPANADQQAGNQQTEIYDDGG